MPGVRGARGSIRSGRYPRGDFAKATLARVDLREATALGITSGVEAVKGATICTLQLFDLAPALAHHIGLTVKDG